MFYGISNLLIQIIQAFSVMINDIFMTIFPEGVILLSEVGFNIYLFSDTGWFTRPIPLLDLYTFVVILLSLIFLLRLLWKATKKFINMIFGVFKV